MMKISCFSLYLILLIFMTQSAMAQLITIAQSGDQPRLSASPNGIIGVTYGQGEDIFYSQSSDNGKSFSKPEKIATLEGLVLGMSSGPQISMGTEYYSVTAPDKYGNLSTWRRKVSGTNWEGPFRINDVPGVAGESLVDLAYDDNGKLYATWIDTRRPERDHAQQGHEVTPERKPERKEVSDGHEKVEKKERPEREDHGGMPQQLTKEEIMKQVGEMPEGAAGVKTYPGSDGKLYWVVVDKEGNALKAQDLEGYKAFRARNGNRPRPQGKIFIASSMDGGKSWSKSQFVYSSPDGSVCECCKPSIRTMDNQVYIMFRNNVDGNRDLYLTQSKDNGKTFAEPEKLGIGSWTINGCPMDGGSLSVTSKEVATVWQREGKVYSASLGMPEVIVGPGRSPVTAITEKGNYILWNNGPNVMAKVPNRNSVLNLGNGFSPQLITLSKDAVLAVWMDGDKIVAKKI